MAGKPAFLKKKIGARKAKSGGKKRPTASSKMPAGLRSYWAKSKK